MELTKPRILLDLEFEEYAQAYLRSLPPEHFMEATPQATQRTITLASFELIKAKRPDFWPFNELLVQYDRPRRRKPGQVVPDNMVVLSEQPIKANTCYNVPLQPAAPYWVLEYVSKGSKRKDYEESFQKYERGLKVPYYLIFYPETQDVSLYRHTGKKYVSVAPDEQGRHPLPELELEVALLDGWARYWFRGQMLPLPADLQAEVDQLRTQLNAKDEQLHAKDEQLRHQAAQLGQMLTLLRSQVEIRARAVDRQEILEQLPAVEDPLQLTLWLAELK